MEVVSSGLAGRAELDEPVVQPALTEWKVVRVFALAAVDAPAVWAELVAVAAHKEPYGLACDLLEGSESQQWSTY